MDRPPERYAVGQEGFDPDVGVRLLIKLDGVEQRDVIEYDCAAGTLTRFKFGDRHQLLLTEDGKEAQRETLTGNVTVEWKP